MFVKRFFEPSVAQASYLIGCAKTGEAIVIDANRDVDQYIDAAAQEGLRITQVSETHIHADYVSGSRELAHQTGASLCLSDEGDADWKYQFAHDRKLKDGDRLSVGNIALDVVHTPGHTPEHITFLVTDGGLQHQLAASGNFGQLLRRNYPVAIAGRFAAAAEEVVTVTGCLCTPLDLLADEAMLPRADVGELVAIFCAGAYGLTASPTAFLSQPMAREMIV